MTIKTLDHAATRLLTPGFRAGSEEVDFSDYENEIPLSHPVDLDAVRSVIDEAMHRYGSTDTTEADAWLAPRLHYALRLTRREAGNRGIWRWLGCVFVPDYVRWRWGATDPDTPDPLGSAAKTERFAGPDYKHALARLWWMAELFRDGPDYLPADLALRNQDIPNNLFRMNIAHHRPTVQAAVKILEGRTGREANALAKAVNSAATTLLVDEIAPDEPLDAAACDRWVARADEVDPVAFFDKLPDGPEDPRTPAQSVDEMAHLLEQLFAEAPVRGRDGE